MKARIPFFLLVLAAVAFGPGGSLPLSAASPEPRSIAVSPAAIIQGDPVMIRIEGGDSASAGHFSVRSISFAGKDLGVFLYQGAPAAFAPVDLYRKPGTYEISAAFSDGTSLEKEAIVAAREKITAPLGIPEKLGGNTPAAATALVDTLAAENATFIGLRTGTHAFWILPFRFPVADPVVTDPYGYSRTTGAYSIAHKGTDFRAAQGMKVMAMNRGVVRIARTYRDYGKTIVVDHGLGLMTFYMHLSRIDVNVGELVTQGEVIGRSGQTGYAAQPHLHLTVRMNDVSIDPVRFMEFFK